MNEITRLAVRKYGTGWMNVCPHCCRVRESYFENKKKFAGHVLACGNKFRKVAKVEEERLAAVKEQEDRLAEIETRRAELLEEFVT